MCYKTTCCEVIHIIKEESSENGAGTFPQTKTCTSHFLKPTKILTDSAIAAAQKLGHFYSCRPISQFGFRQRAPNSSSNPRCLP